MHYLPLFTAVFENFKQSIVAFQILNVLARTVEVA